MALTSFDSRTALILIDLQKGILSAALVHPVAQVLGNARRLADAFRERSLPVVLVNVARLPPGRTGESRPRGDFPPDWSELVPELNRQPTDHLVTKRSPGAFAHTDLENYLRGCGTTQVVVGGVVTSFGVESTARAAYDLGFNVTFATDAMSDRTQEAHDHSVERIFPRLGETGSTQEIVELLKR